MLEATGTVKLDNNPDSQLITTANERLDESVSARLANYSPSQEMASSASSSLSPKSSDDNAVGNNQNSATATATSSPSSVLRPSSAGVEEQAASKMPHLNFKSLFGSLLVARNEDVALSGNVNSCDKSKPASAPQVGQRFPPVFSTSASPQAGSTPHVLFQRLLEQPTGNGALSDEISPQESPPQPKQQTLQHRQRNVFHDNQHYSKPTEDNRPSGATLGSEKKRSYPYTFQFCVLCQKNVHSSKLPCHIRQCHVGKPMFQCPQCDFTSTYSKNNVKSHMVSLHGLAGDPISYMDDYAGQVEEFMKRCFPNVRGRGRPVHGRVSPVSIDKWSSFPLKRQKLSSSAIGTGKSSSGQSGNVVGKNEYGISENECLRVAKENTPTHIGAGSPPTRRTAGGGSQRSSSNRATQREVNNKQQQACQIDSRAHGNYNAHGGLLGAAAAYDFKPALSMAPTLDNMLQLLTATAPAFYTLPLSPNHTFGGVTAPVNPFFYLQQLSELANGAAAIEQKQRSNSLSSAKPGKANGRPVQLADTKLFKEVASSLDRSVSETELKVGSVSDKSKTRCPQSAASHLSRTNGHANKGNGSSGGNFIGSKANEPCYLPQPLKWALLEGEQTVGTVFKTFTNTSEIIEKLGNLAEFESLAAQSSLLTPAQSEKISCVRRHLGLKSFEIMFAVHRLDLQVLKVENVKLVESIAPTATDLRRFAAYEQRLFTSDFAASLSEEEQFLVQLAKIDCLNEKLAAMRFMGEEFAETVTTVEKGLSTLLAASKFLRNSPEFHTIIHLALIIGNLINGDFNAELIAGFQVSSLSEACSFRLPNGQSFAELLAAKICSEFTEIFSIEGKYHLLEDASEITFATLIHELHQLEHKQSLLELEASNSGANPNSSVSSFLSNCESETARLWEIADIAKKELLGMLNFFGEPANPSDEISFSPEAFFKRVSDFLAKLFNEISKWHSLNILRTALRDSRKAAFFTMPGTAGIRGHLEKKKEWIQRSRDFQEKNRKLRKLKQSALNRNPDEFHFHMANSRVGLDGMHRDLSDSSDEETEAQKLLSDIRDLQYVRHKHSQEQKKIEKLKATLHFTRQCQHTCKRIVFTDSDGDDGTIAPNRNVVQHKDDGTTKEADERKAIERESKKQYAELRKREEREKELRVVAQKLELKKNLVLSKKSIKPQLVERGDQSKAAVYKWVYDRKK